MPPAAIGEGSIMLNSIGHYERCQVARCLQCPVSRKSRRRPIRWGHVARELGVTLPALRAAIESERRRDVAVNGNGNSDAGGR